MAKPSEEDLFAAASQLHRQAALQAAVEAYQRVLHASPRHAGAMNRLGRLALRGGDFSRAADYARQALDIDPAQAEFYVTLGEAQRGSGNLAEAVQAYRRAVQLQPDFADAHCNLGTLLQAQGDLAGAAESYRRALAARNGYALAHHNLAVVLQLQGDLAAAAEHFATAAYLDPATIESELGLGYVLKAQGQVAQATQFFEAAVCKHPDQAAAHAGLGYLYQSQNRPEEALACYQTAVRLAPQSALAHYNLATALRNLGRPAEALESFETSLRLDPTSADALVGQSGTCLELQQIDAAVAAARAAVERAPLSHAPLAQLYRGPAPQGELDEAIAVNKRIVAEHPGDAGGHSNLLYSLLAHEQSGISELLVEHLAWSERHAEPLTRQAPPHPPIRAAGRRLRIGYVSAHFRQHAVSFFSEPMIAAHDHQRFEIHCYSDVGTPDATTARFRGYADVWRDTADWSDEELAQAIRADRIDILVDLAGHIGGNRLLAFARRPAPIQVTYLGYQATTGMSALDYRLTDAHADPPGPADLNYRERLVRLPRAFFCYAAPSDAPQVNELPALSAGRFTFGSFNQPIKIRPLAWQVWARILDEVPDARLLVLAHGGGAFERNAHVILAEAGVDPNRLRVVDQRSHVEFLRLHHTVDLMLDTFPFNGHTTVCDALWMGVPSIMLAGDTYASRFGTSVLRNLGLDEFVADSLDAYVRAAVSLAGQRERLAELRAGMRVRMQNSPLLDAVGFTRNLEDAYLEMARNYDAQGG